LRDHKTTYCPIMPLALDVRDNGARIDIGLMAEALLYYDHVYIDVCSSDGMAAFLRELFQRDCYREVRELFETGVLRVASHTFGIAPVMTMDGTTSIWGALLHGYDKKSFTERHVTPEVVAACHTKKAMEWMLATMTSRLREFHSSTFEEAIQEARRDAQVPERAALSLQVYVDELWRLRKVPGQPPRVNVTVT
jgi:hypothetical protein